MKVEVKTFDELSVKELYSILHLRSEVFVVEQCCVYQDLDFIDESALHLFIREQEGIVAYARVLAPGLSYQEASLGRLLVAKAHRKKGYAKTLTSSCLNEITNRFPGKDIKIMAQVYLRDFYMSFGFQVISEEFREDHLPHIYMLKKH